MRFYCMIYRPNCSLSNYNLIYPTVGLSNICIGGGIGGGGGGGGLQGGYASPTLIYFISIVIKHLKNIQK